MTGRVGSAGPTWNPGVCSATWNPEMTLITVLCRMADGDTVTLAMACVGLFTHNCRTVSPSAILQSTVISVISGFQVAEQTPGFQVGPADPTLPVIGLPVTNAFYPVQNSLYPGAIASIYGQNLQ